MQFSVQLALDLLPDFGRPSSLPSTIVRSIAVIVEERIPPLQLIHLLMTVTRLVVQVVESRYVAVAHLPPDNGSAVIRDHTHPRDYVRAWHARDGEQPVVRIVCARPRARKMGPSIVVSLSARPITFLLELLLTNAGRS